MKRLFIALLFFAPLLVFPQEMVVTVHTPTNSMEESMDFYSKLNYELVSKAKPVLFSDGKFLIEINDERVARAGVKMYKGSWTEEVASLKELTQVYETEDGFALNDFNGCWIYLVEGELGVETKLSGESTGLSGNFMGLTLEAANMNKSVEIWSALGFEIAMGTVEQGFVQMQHENGFGVAMLKPLVSPHLFFNPSLTFFNGENNLALIEKIRALDISITEEITIFNKEDIVDNIIIRDPGGLGFFIFSD